MEAKLWCSERVSIGNDDGMPPAVLDQASQQGGELENGLLN